METGNVTKKTASLPANVMEQDAGKRFRCVGSRRPGIAFFENPWTVITRSKQKGW